MACQLFFLICFYIYLHPPTRSLPRHAMATIKQLAPMRRRLCFHHLLTVPVLLLAAAAVQECAAQGGGGDRAPLVSPLAKDPATSLYTISIKDGAGPPRRRPRRPACLVLVRVRPPDVPLRIRGVPRRRRVLLAPAGPAVAAGLRCRC